MKSEAEIPKSTFSIPSKIKQLKVFITRDVLSKLTNSQYMTINMLEAPVLALILAFFVKYRNTDVSSIGYIFRENENIPIYMFMAVVVVLFIGLTVSAEEIIKDRKILKREAFLNLSKGGYLFSKIVIMFVLSAIQTISLIIIGNWILEIKGMVLDYWIILFSASCFANMLGLNISSAFNSAVTIYILIPFILIPQLLFSGVMVKFDKLHPSVIVHNSVPWIGELMLTRWAYEALATNQFKENKFEKRFYKYDREKSIADFKKVYWIPKLKSKIDACLNNIDNEEKKDRLVNDLSLLRNEMSRGFGLFKDSRFILDKSAIDSLSVESFNPGIAKKAKDALNFLHKYYIDKYIKASSAKDKIISRLNATPEGKKQFIEDKDNYVNEALRDLVTNKNELNRIIEVDGELVQQIDPIFLDPVKDNNIRTHFYAPRKKLFGRLYDTFWVNAGVIWGMSILLAVTLYFDLFRKFIDSLGDIFGKLANLIPSKSKDQRP